MTADLLRRAAAKARETAAAATPGPWEVEGQGPGPDSRYMGCGVVYTMDDSVMGGDIAAPAGDCYPRGGYSPMEDMSHIALWDPLVTLAIADWLDATAETHQPDVEPVELMLHMDEECPTGECVDGDGHSSIVCIGCYPAWEDMQAHTVWPCAEYRRAEPVARLLLGEDATPEADAPMVTP